MKPTSVAPQVPTLTRPKLTGNNVKAGPVFEQKLYDAVMKKNGSGMDYFGGMLVKMGYSEQAVIQWITKVAAQRDAKGGRK